MNDKQPNAEIDQRVVALVDNSDLGWVTDALARQRDQILEHWLDAAAEQPFHAGHREHAVADHIPALVDAVIDYLRRSAPRRRAVAAPFSDEAVLASARAHATIRLDQGLEPVDVVIEFRLLRQEILGALREELADSVPTRDVIAAEILVNDALDGAISLAMRALTDLIETVREDFLATTIHDVRQPLTLIKASTQLAARMLRRPDADMERVLEELHRVDGEATRMASLLTELIDASRIALQQLDLQREETDLAALIGEVVEQLGPETAGRVRMDLATEGDTRGHWDHERLERVIRNLLSNAVKYSEPGSPIEVRLRAAGAALELSVRDYGIGIAAEDLPRLFQRYARARGAVERGIEGLGLGLYLSRGIVQAHGGRIWATSAGAGTGTTFHVVLPRDGGMRDEG